MPTICTVSGIVLQPSGVPFSGVTVIATLDRPFIYPATGEVIPNFVQTTITANDGTWSLPLIETTTSGVTVTFAFQYSTAAGSSPQRYEYTATIPDASSASFSDIINTTSDGEGFVVPAVPAYDTFADLPTTAANGFLARVLTSPASLYEYDLATTTWNLVGPGGGSAAGITSINADTTSAQTIITGSSGTDFAITTLGGVTTIGIPTASITNRGLLSSADWFTFNAKQNSIVSANLTAAGTDGIVVTGGTGSILSAASLAQHVSDSTHNGYLSSTDWSTFNNKQATITTGNLTESTSAILTITGGSSAVIGSGTTIQVKQASASQAGFLSSSDFSTFNSKGSGTVTAVSVASSNGFTGSSSGGATPALTLGTSLTGILQGNGTAISAVTNTGTGNNVLATSPTLTTPNLGTPTTLVLTAATGLSLTTGVTGILPTANGGTGVSSSAWQAYTPTLTGVGTATGVSFLYRRSGPDLLVKGIFTTGTCTAVLFSTTLPSGLVIDTQPLLNTTSNAGPQVGSYTQTITNTQGALVTATGTSTALVYMGDFYLDTAGTTTLTPTNANHTINNGLITSINFSVPIVGWN